MSNNKYSKAFDPATVALETSNLIEASAGTGKTYSIAILTLRLVLEKNIPIQQILMVTFTRAAVAELETRIRLFMRNALKVSQGVAIKDETITAIVQSSMNGQADGPGETERLLKEAVLFLDETSILTIHSFSQRILTEFAFETRQVFGSEILTDFKAIITDKVNSFWRKYITTLHTGLLQYLISAGLTRAKLEEVIKNTSSGKAMVQLQPLPADFLSVSHQSALYNSLSGFDQRKEVIKNNAIHFISSSMDTIRPATEKNAYTNKNMLHLLNDPEALFEAICKNADKANVRKVYPEIILDHEDRIRIEEEKVLFLKLIFSHVYQYAIEIITIETDRYKQQNNQLGFDDMITKLHQAVVRDNNEFLISSLQVKYKAAFIDEFQDTDKMQYEIFNRLFAGVSVLFYIGDPKQSIYAWRKADIFTYFKAREEVTNIFGMDINYRSSSRFIEAMNRFFLPAKDFDTFYFSNESHAIHYIQVAPPGESGKGELYKEQQPDVPLTIFENSSNDSISETVVAQIIQLLGTNQFTIEEKGGCRKIHPSDIGILVRKNKQATLIKQLLSKYGIPAVTIDDSKLLQSMEARNILYLLAAVTGINRSSINKALLSPLTRFTAANILAMDEEEALGRFKQYQYLWEHEGVYVMLTRFIADYKIKEVLLNQTEGNGERSITNVLQLMELLHKTQTQKQLSTSELVNWLKRGIEGMEVEGDEFEQRVESDEEAVKIVTIHKSKGLEYNIVFAPFLDLKADSEFGFVSFREPDTGEYLFSDSYLLDDEQVQQNARQQEQENRRLIYVAVTRAVYKCYINKNTFGYFTQSAITPFVNAVKENKSVYIEFESSPVLPEHYNYSSSAQQLRQAYLQAADFQLKEVNWRKLSYTYMDVPHVSALKKNAANGLDVYDEFIFKTLQRGADTGNLLHYIFERIDFSDTVYWQPVIEAALKRFRSNPPSGYSIHLVALLHHVTGAHIHIGKETFTLQELHREKRLNELEFDFNVAPFDPDDFARLSTPELPVRVRYAKELEGIMNGKIDLFFEHAGKYFILDWKSNFLGDSVTDYSKENIDLAMAESNYHLQYFIYTLAVKKYLQVRVPGFDYNTHFGGVIYLFVRGVRKGREQGVFTYRPPESLIDKLDGLLSKTGGGKNI